MSETHDIIQPRVKRQKYTQNACNECKRRKAKCNGAEPRCERCVSFDVQCVYTASHGGAASRGSERGELRQLHEKIDILQEQISNLIKHLQRPAGPPVTSPSIQRSQLKRASIGASPTSSTPLDQRRQPAYLGPTSSTFGLEVAQAELRRTQSGNAGTSRRNEERSSSSSSTEDDLDRDEDGTNHETKVFEKGEALRLIGLYEETVGTIYPCVDIGGVKNLAREIFDRSDNAVQACDTIYGSDDFSDIFDRDMEILRTILAISYAIDDNGRSVPAKTLINKVEDTMSRRYKIPEVDTKELLLLLLLSFYYFYRGDEVMAYRSTGLALRAAIEMGLHRRSTWTRTSGIFPGELQRSWAIKLFWCLYVLDRRWSLGTGMPFCLQDEDMDTELPELDETTPYLKCLVAYSRLASKVWKSVTNSDYRERRLDTDSAPYLDFLVQEWSKSIPANLQIQNVTEVITSPSERTQRMLQTLLHLRANQMRSILHKPDLLSKDTIIKNPHTTQLVVDVALDTIHHVELLNRTTDIYQRQRVEFDYFLVSAVAVLFLAVSLAPDRFEPKAQEGFQKVLGLVKGFPSSSLSTRRLWKTIRQLRRIGFQFEQQPPTTMQGSSNSRPKHCLTPGPALNGTGMDPNAAPGDVTTVSGDLWPADELQVYQELGALLNLQEHPQSWSHFTGDNGTEQWPGFTDVGGEHALTGADYDRDNAEFLRLLTDLF